MRAIKLLMIGFGLIAVTLVAAVIANWDAPRHGGASDQAAQAATKPAKRPLCAPASQEQLTQLMQWRFSGGTKPVGPVLAVRSGSHERAQYIGARVLGPGLEDGPVGVWFMTGSAKRPSGMTLAVNGIAREFSDAPDGCRTKAETCASDDEVHLLEACFRQMGGK
jgi:hypothetical protein